MVNYRNFQDIHIEAARALWAKTEWTSVSQADEPDALRTFIDRNPTCSWIAEIDVKLVGTVLAGHDARRGYIYHLVVEEAECGKGIGRMLLNKAVESVRMAGVAKCHAIVLDGNPASEFFWAPQGWYPQNTTQYSKFLS